MMGFPSLGGLCLNVPLMKFSYLKLLCYWNFPNSKSVLPLLGFLPLGELCLYTPQLRFPHSETATQTCLSALSRLAYGNRNLCYGISPTRSPYSAAGISPCGPSFDVSLMGFSPLRNTNTRLRLPTSDPQADEPQAVSLCRVHARSPLYYWDFSHSE